MCFHITHEGNLVQTILLPSVFIVIETAINELIVNRFRQFKIKTKDQLKEIIRGFYKPDKIQVYSKKAFLETAEQEPTKNHKMLFDFFRAAEKGLLYLFESPVHVQILSLRENIIVIIKLVNRIAFLEYEKETSTTKIIEATKRMFEQELDIKDDIPELVLEK